MPIGGGIEEYVQEGAIERANLTLGVSRREEGEPIGVGSFIVAFYTIRS